MRVQYVAGAVIPQVADWDAQDYLPAIPWLACLCSLLGNTAFPKMLMAFAWKGLRGSKGFSGEDEVDPKGRRVHACGTKTCVARPVSVGRGVVGSRSKQMSDRSRGKC